MELCQFEYLKEFGLRPQCKLAVSCWTRGSLVSLPSNPDRPRNFQLFYILHAHLFSSIRCISWSPTGNLIATGSVDRTLRIWNPEKNQVKHSTELRGHTGAVERVAWNPTKDGELASVSHDGTLRIWDVRSRICLATVNIGGEGLTVAWSPEGKLLIVGRKDDVIVPVSVGEGVAAGEGEGAAAYRYVVRQHIPQSQQTNQIIFAPLRADSSFYTLLLTTGSGTIKICSYPLRPVSIHGEAKAAAASNTDDASETSVGNLPVLHLLASHTSSTFCLELATTGRYLATGGSDALICLWDTTEWVCRRSLDRMSGAVRGLSFSFDGAYVVGSSDEGTGLEIAHAETGEYVYTVGTGGGATPCVAWHPGRYWLAYSGDSGGLKIFGAAGGGL